MPDLPTDQSVYTHCCPSDKAPLLVKALLVQGRSINATVFWVRCEAMLAPACRFCDASGKKGWQRLGVVQTLIFVTGG